MVLCVILQGMSVPFIITLSKEIEVTLSCEYFYSSFQLRMQNHICVVREVLNEFYGLVSRLEKHLITSLLLMPAPYIPEGTTKITE